MYIFFKNLIALSYFGINILFTKQWSSTSLAPL